MTKENTLHKHFTLSHIFSLSSLLSILICILVLFYISRSATVYLLTEYGQQSNTNIVETIFGPLHVDLVTYINASNNLSTDMSHHIPLSNTLKDTIDKSLSTQSIINISIYNNKCIAIYSTDSSYIGRDFSGLKPLSTSIGGLPSTTFSYHDSLSLTYNSKNGDNTITTYVPIIDKSNQTVGVISITTNASDIVSTIEWKLRYFWIILVVVLLALYLILTLVVKHAYKLISLQQNIITERNNKLEQLSIRLLEFEDQEKKQIAEILHEDIAQTLSALKLYLDNYTNTQGTVAASSEHKQLTEILIPAIHAAIDDVRELAMDIRPASIDDIGLLPTITWLLRRFNNQGPAVQIHHDFDLDEQDIPKTLAIPIYRIIEMILQDIFDYSTPESVHLYLGKVDKKLILQLKNRVNTVFSDSVSNGYSENERLDSTSIKERVTISKGALEIVTQKNGDTAYQILWPI